jgi:DDE superfamily endonuclease
VAPPDPRCFQFIDESGVNLAMTRLYGRAPRGERVIGPVPHDYGPNVTMLAALGSHGVEVVMTIDGATDAEVFRIYIDQVLRPTLHPGDIVIMDNLRVHTGGASVRLLSRPARGCCICHHTPPLWRPLSAAGRS